MKTFNYYCDESTHLENDKQPYMLLSYVSSAYNQVKLHQDNIRAIKEKHGFNFEMKWSSVSKGQYAFYSELIDYFFANDLQFRAIVVNKEQVKNNQYQQSYDDFYYKMYYQLISQKMNFEYSYNVYLDIKDTLSAHKVHKLKEICNFFNLNDKPIRTVQNIRSHESLLMQMTDLLMGAINYHLRGMDKVIAKNKLIEKIQHHSKISLEKSTAKNSDKFNLFFIDLK